MMNRLKKILYYNLVKITIDVASIAKVIINMIVKCYHLLKSIKSSQGLIFTSKFWSLLC